MLQLHWKRYGDAWWRHQMEAFSALLALRAGNSPVPGNSPHKGQGRGALMFSLICARINGWVNNREAGDLRRHRGHYDVTVMVFWLTKYLLTSAFRLCFVVFFNLRTTKATEWLVIQKRQPTKFYLHGAGGTVVCDLSCTFVSSCSNCFNLIQNQYPWWRAFNSALPHYSDFTRVLWHIQSSVQQYV